MTTLYTPPDAFTAHETWNANCGPTAVAALLGRPLADVRHAFPWFPARPRCSPTQVSAVLATLGWPAKWTALGLPKAPAANEADRMALELDSFDRMPEAGLVFVQIDGPWCYYAHRGFAYHYTHWVAVRRIVVNATPLTMVYDVNAGSDEQPGGWLPVRVWSETIMNLLVADHKRATGWFVRSVFEGTARPTG